MENIEVTASTSYSVPADKVQSRSVCNVKVGLHFAFCLILSLHSTSWSPLPDSAVRLELFMASNVDT